MSLGGLIMFIVYCVFTCIIALHVYFFRWELCTFANSG